MNNNFCETDTHALEEQDKLLFWDMKKIVLSEYLLLYLLNIIPFGFD
jgi:hypothetical protein